MVYMPAKFDEKASNSLVCIRFTNYFHVSTVTLTFDLQNQQGPSSHNG